MSAVIPNVDFVNVELNNNKERILSCSTNDEICDVFNDIFNSHCILFQTSELPTSTCSNMEWSIHNGFTSVSKIVMITFGAEFISKFNEFVKIKWKNFCSSIETIIGHEFIHIYQLHKIPEDISIKEFNLKSTDIDYLSNKHEICAFAYQAVQEFKLNGLANNDIIEGIKIPSEMIFDSDVFWSYIYYFRSGDIVLKRFLNLIYEYCKL
jgi:hypothetical protein